MARFHGINNESSKPFINLLVIRTFIFVLVVMTVALYQISFLQFNDDRVDDCEMQHMSSFLLSSYSSKMTWDYCGVSGKYFHNSSDHEHYIRSTHRLVILGMKQYIPVGEMTTWHIHVEDMVANRPVPYGGSVIRIQINGSSLCRPIVADMRNGTYLAMFRIFDKGPYTAYISLRWPACQGYVFCNPETLQQPLLSATTVLFNVTERSVSNKYLPRPIGSSGRWVLRDNGDKLKEHLHPLLDGPYIWKTWLDPLQLFPTKNLRWDTRPLFDPRESGWSPNESCRAREKT